MSRLIVIEQQQQRQQPSTYMKEEEPEDRKRPIESDLSSSEDESDGDVFGPSITAKNSSESNEAKLIPKKKHKKKFVVPESILMSNIPLKETYRYSYEQESIISSINKTSNDELLIIGLKNGTVKFYKKQIASNNLGVSNHKSSTQKEEVDGQIELLKRFAAHPNKEINQLLVDEDNSYLASIAHNDSNIKIFDLQTLDMIQVIKLDFLINTLSKNTCCWVKSDGASGIIINEKDTNKLYLINPENEGYESIKQVHKFPLTSIVYSSFNKCFISSDTKGIIEYWDIKGNLPQNISFKYKSETNLFDIIKNKVQISSITLSPDQSLFVTVSFPDECIRIFDFKTGQLTKKIQESISVYDKNEEIHSKLINIERRLLTSDFNDLANQRNVLFDESGKLLIFLTLLGIKILNLQTMKIIRILGTGDQIDSTIRLNNNLLFNKSSVGKYNGEILSSDNTLIDNKLSRNPIIVSIAVNSSKIYIFNDKSGIDSDNRDFTLKSLTKGSDEVLLKSDTARYVTLHTTLGDIKIKLFQNLAPRTVKTFTELCEKGLYSNVLFNTVMEQLKIQAGDTASHDVNFILEVNPLLNYSKPFMLSTTNIGTQFFINTVRCSWLDGKHTIFGEVVDGHETIKSIENSETDEDNRPLDQIAIISTKLER